MPVLAGYNVIVLGLETDQYKEIDWDLRAALADYGLFDWIGLGPLKQIEVMRRCKVTIMTPTGAVVLPVIYGVPSICISGGEWPVDYWDRISEPFHVVPCLCDYHPCNTRRPYKCSKRPECLAEAINVEGLREVLESGQHNKAGV